MEREKPDNADRYNWDEFNKWANTYDLGHRFYEYSPYWDCWVRAILEERMKQAELNQPRSTT